MPDPVPPAPPTSSGTDTPLSPDAAALAAAMDTLLTIISGAITVTERGDSLDLTGLDTEAAALCKAVVHFSPSEARHFLPRLEAMLAGLERLENSVKVGAALKAPERPAQSPRAAAAYRRAEDPELG